MARKPTLETLCRAKFPGKSWEEIGVLLDVTARTLYRLRTGAVRKPTRSVLRVLANGLGVSPEAVAAAIKAGHRDAS